MSIDVEIKNNENIIDRNIQKKCIFSLNESLIQTLWDYVSEFIEFNMLRKKGVHIPGLGTFSFNQVKLDVGQNKYVLFQRPLFILSEKICQNHGLKQNKTLVTGSIPVVTLNYCSLMMKSTYSRDQIETCVRELIAGTNNSIANQSGTELVFTKIGRLQIRNQQVKFKFYKSFISTLDNSGKVLKFMQNRPGTADSVMTERPLTRSFSTNIPLPKISTSIDCQKLPTIDEQDIFEPKITNVGCENVLHVDEADEQVGQSMFDEKDELDQNPAYEDEQIEPNNIADMSNDFVKPTKSISSNDSHPIYDEPQSGKNSSQRNENENVTLTRELTLPVNNIINIKIDPLPIPKPPSRSSLLSEPRKVPSIYSNSRPSTTASSVCGHSGPGQDLCYVCYQREKRNVPISFSEQIKEREKEEERVLQAFQNMKDTEHLLKDQENLLAKKHDCQKISAYNSGIAEAMRLHHKSKDPNMYRSYIFQNRPLTPPKIIKQTILNTELGKQVERKMNTKKKNEEDEAFMERLEQMQLAEDLAKQRDKYIKDKERSKDLYKKDLDTQVSTKSLPIPKYQPDSEEPIFGKNDVTQDKLIEKRQKAHEVFRNQLECAEQKKKDMLMKKIQDQNHEEYVLDKVKSDLMDDRALRYQRAMQNRLKLESEWEKANTLKKERDLMERIKISMPNKLLVHEQCDKWTRCTQCKRKLNNVGQTNIWKETHFVPGTRYIY